MQQDPMGCGVCLCVQELKKTGAIKNIYNVTPDCTKAIFFIVAQAEEFRVSVSVTLTSTTMREEPTPEQAKGMRA